jgi:hypothetical protein
MTLEHAKPMKEYNGGTGFLTRHLAGPVASGDEVAPSR